MLTELVRNISRQVYLIKNECLGDHPEYIDSMIDHEIQAFGGLWCDNYSNI